MDLFFQQSHENFFTNFQLATNDHDTYGAEELITENDENIHDLIESRILSKPRSLNDLPPGLQLQPIDNIKGIIESLQCPFCLEVAAQPVFIKHCLHFFCKPCIEQQIRLYKKECPLCKKSMGTKRELRQSQKLEVMLQILRPYIDRHYDQDQVNIDEVKKKTMDEQLQMAKLKNYQMNQNVNSKKRSAIEDELMKEVANEEDSFRPSNDDDLTDYKSVDEIEEQRRIQRKVEKLRAASNKNDILNKLIKVQAQMNQEDQIKTLMLSPDDAKYYRSYERLKLQLRNNQDLNSKSLKIYDKPPQLDMRVKVLFDEDLKTMIFPKVKEFLFRASSDSPLEIAAKALAYKNEHPQIWKSYSFSIIRKRKVDDETWEQQEVQIEDLKKSFGMFKDSLEQQEIILFYKINAEFKSPFKVGQINEDQEEEAFGQMQD